MKPYGKKHKKIKPPGRVWCTCFMCIGDVKPTKKIERSKAKKEIQNESLLTEDDPL